MSGQGKGSTETVERIGKFLVFRSPALEKAALAILEEEKVLLEGLGVSEFVEHSAEQTHLHKAQIGFQEETDAAIALKVLCRFTFDSRG